jgi:hypothetical protein
MKKLWCGLLIGLVAVGGVASCLIKGYSSDSQEPSKTSLPVPEQQAPSGPALQVWQQIWVDNMPMPELVPPSEPPAPATKNQVILFHGFVENDTPRPKASSVESRLEQLAEKLEQIEKRLDALEQRKEKKKKCGFWMSSLQGVLAYLVDGFPGFVEDCSSDPQVRIRELIEQSEDMHVIQQEWEQIWYIDHPSHLTPIRVEGAVSP